MRALVLGPEGPAFDPSYAAAPRVGEAVIRPRLAGVCATDLELVKGYMGFQGVLGHEWVGTVESAPDPSWAGRRVVGEINCGCGTCERCLRGEARHCASRSVLGIQDRDGAFADRLCLPLANLHPVPDNVPDEAAVFIEPLAAALRVTEQVHIRPEDRVVVLGLGRLGQLVARVLALTGAEVVGVSRSALRRSLLPRGLRALSPEELPGQPLANVVVECTGQPTGLEAARRLLCPRGTLVLKSTIHDVGSSNPTLWVIDEIQIVGSRCGPFAPALRLLERGLVDPTPLVTARFPLEQGVAALDAARAPGAIKVLLDVDP